MTETELAEILRNAPEFRKGIEAQLIENHDPDQALDYHSVACAYPWHKLDHPDYYREQNESHIPFIDYGLLKKRMDELGYNYQETEDPHCLTGVLYSTVKRNKHHQARSLRRGLSMYGGVFGV